MNLSASRPRYRINGKPQGRSALCIVAVLSVMALAACDRDGQAADADQADGSVRTRTPSGFPVPRYVSLKFDEVNARGGPGDDYKLLWTYRVRGLPLQVIAETPDWRRVCDPEGQVAWVHQRTVDTRRTVMRTAVEPIDLHRRPAADAPVSARLAGRSVADLESCKDGWCEISAGGVEGWIPEGEVWGTAPSIRCQAPLPVVER